jgi:hypothetical protein
LEGELTNEYVDELIANKKITASSPDEINSAGGNSQSFMQQYRSFLNYLVNSLDNSVFKVIVSRERSYLEILSPRLWALAPVVGVIAGIGLSILQLHEGGISSAPIYIYFILSVFVTSDLLSGLLGVSSFILIQLFFGHPKNFREVLAIFAISIATLAPSLIYSLVSTLGNTSHQGEGELGGKNRFSVAHIVGAFLGGVAFNVGLIICFSLHITMNTDTNISLIFPLAIAFFIIGKNLYIDEKVESVVNKPGDKEYELITTSVGRIFSPLSGVVLYLVNTGVIYIWSEKWIFSAEIGALLSLPYLLLFMQFTQSKSRILLKMKRNWLAESLLVLIFSLGIIMGIEKLPLNILQRSHYFIFVSAIPIILHAIYSAVWDGADRGVYKDEIKELEVERVL